MEKYAVELEKNSKVIDTNHEGNLADDSEETVTEKPDDAQKTLF